jgi:heptose I phosphotransferase
VSYGSLWERWARGVSWTWINERYRSRVPEDLDATVMSLESPDRFHAKQGRSTARVVLEQTNRPLAVYLKRHYRLPWPTRLAALLQPAGRYSPAATEWSNLERVRAMGIEVPEVVAVGEHVGPRTALHSFLMVAELTGCTPLNELLPQLAGRLDPESFEKLKQRLFEQMAGIIATLHRAGVFHKDLYLCHFFVDHASIDADGATPRMVLIDLHRLREHRLWSNWWRWKDLAQLLFSTYGVGGITRGDRAWFWWRYRSLVGIDRPDWQKRMILLRARRYDAHNRKQRQRRARAIRKSVQRDLARCDNTMMPKWRIVDSGSDTPRWIRQIPDSSSGA